MQFVILGLLLTESLSLYDVHKRFSGSVSLFYSASFGALRRALGQLVDAGHATVADAADVRRGKKLYRITLEGRDAWLRWMRNEYRSLEPWSRRTVSTFINRRRRPHLCVSDS